MKLRKTILTAVLILVFLCSAVCVHAADEKPQAAAEVLYDLGLLAGTGTNEDGSPNFSLDRALTRQEAMTLFINLLGKGREAMRGSWKTPFTDVDDWAKPFVGYAYQNGFTAGVAEDLFGAGDPVTADQYMTYLLLALGYEQGTDFAWNESSLVAVELGFDEQVFTGGPFYRSQAVLCNCSALALPKKDSGECLLGEFEGKPADAEFIGADNGFLYAWNEGKRSVVAQYGTDRSLIARYEADRVESRYDGLKHVRVLLRRYDIGDGRSFGYYYGMSGLYRMTEGKLEQLSSRPVAQMIFTRQGAQSSGPIILSFSPKSPVYSEYELFGGDTIIEIGENGTEDVLLHGNTGHGIEIDEIHPMDSVTEFSAVESAGMGHMYGFDYALLRKYNEAAGKYRPSISVLRYTPGPEGGTEIYAQRRQQEEQERLNALGIGL